MLMNTLQKSIDDFRRTPDGKIIQGASHTSRVLNHKYRNGVIMNTVCDLRKISNDFDSIACSGISGLIIVPQIAEILNKNIIILRKAQEKRYSEFEIEGVTPFRYIIIDDLICSGRTVRHIKNTIKEECPRSHCIGVYCYMPEECAYRDNEEGSKLCKRDLGIPLLNIR
jgi:adenine/guanine phosphoribosyltransferase-like PRPP-binding protein